MNPEPEDPIWQKLSRTLFGVRRMSDEALFTYQVMERVRASTGQEMSWHRFLRLAIPVLGVGVATLVLATRPPALPAPQLMETALFNQQLPDQDPLTNVL